MKVFKDKQGNQFVKIKDMLCKLFYNPKQRAFSTWFENEIIWLKADGKIIKRYNIKDFIEDYKIDNCKRPHFYIDHKRSCELCPSIAICQCSTNTQRYIPRKAKTTNDK